MLKETNFNFKKKTFELILMHTPPFNGSNETQHPWFWLPIFIAININMCLWFIIVIQLDSMVLYQHYTFNYQTRPHGWDWVTIIASIQNKTMPDVYAHPAIKTFRAHLCFGRCNKYSDLFSSKYMQYPVKLTN